MKRICSLVAVILVLLIATPVLAAYTVYSILTVLETAGNSYSSLPVIISNNNTYLQYTGFINATGNNTAVKLGGSDIPYMLADNKTLFVIPALSAMGQVSPIYYLGYDPVQTSFDIITGVGGYVSTADNSTLELGNNFEIEQKGYVNINSGASKNLVNKAGAVSVYVDPTTTGQINATFWKTSSLAQVLVGGSADPIAPTLTEYNFLMGGMPASTPSWNTTESVNYQVMPTAGAISSMYIRLSANVAAGTATFTVMKNGAPTAVLVVINAGASTGNDLVNSASFVAGDTVSLRYVTSGASGTPFAQWTTLWNSAAPNESIFLLNATTVIANTVYNIPQGKGGLAGGVGITDESFVKVPMPTAGTFSKLYVKLSADPGTPGELDRYVFTLRKNTADTALTTTITADNTTGNDVVNTVAVVADDLMTISITPQNVPLVAPYAAIGMVFTPTISGESVIVGGSPSEALSTTGTRFTYLGGSPIGASSWSMVEANQYELTQLTVISKLYVKLRTAPGAGASYTFTVREAVANTLLAVTISGTATTGNDVVDTYTSAKGAVTSIQSVPTAGTPAVSYATWGLVSNYPRATVSVSELSSGEKTVTTRADPNNPRWATGNVLHFDGTTISYVNAGAIYNAQAKLWVSLWFKLDNNYGPGSPLMKIISKSLGANSKILVFLNPGDGKLFFQHIEGGVTLFALSPAATSWASNTWYHILASMSSVNGARFRINNSEALTDADNTALPNGGNFIIGNEIVDVGMVGQIFNVIVGTDDLTPAEETALYNGTAPGDETDYWYIDEGTGNTIYSYGSAANNGTKSVATAWQTSTYTAGKTGRLADFTLQVDSTRVGANLESLGASAGVPNNSNDWYFMQGNVSSHTEYITIDVSGTEVLRYQPNAMIRGQAYSTGTVTVTNGSTTVEGAGGATWTSAMVGSIFKSTNGVYYVVGSITDSDTLVLTAVYAGGTLGGQTYNLYPRVPDRTGTAQDGAITWGNNPAGVASTMGVITPYSAVSAGAAALGTPDAITPGTMPNLYPTTGPSSNFPLYGLLSTISGKLAVPILITWTLLGTIISTAAGLLVASSERKNVVITTLVVGVVLAIFAVIGGGIIGIWFIVVYCLQTIPTVMLHSKFSQG